MQKATEERRRSRGSRLLPRCIFSCVFLWGVKEGWGGGAKGNGSTTSRLLWSIELLQFFSLQNTGGGHTGPNPLKKNNYPKVTQRTLCGEGEAAKGACVIRRREPVWLGGFSDPKVGRSPPFSPLFQSLVVVSAGLLKIYILQPFETCCFFHRKKKKEATMYKAMFRCIM